MGLESTVIAGCCAASWDAYCQCVVARRPSSSPVAARMLAPVHRGHASAFFGQAADVANEARVNGRPLVSQAAGDDQRVVVMPVCYLIFGALRGSSAGQECSCSRRQGCSASVSWPWWRAGGGSRPRLVRPGGGLARSRCLGPRPPPGQDGCASRVGGVVLRRRPARRCRDDLHAVASPDRAIDVLSAVIISRFR